MTASLGSSESDCKPRKLGKRLQKLLTRMKSGERICKTIRSREVGESYFLWEPSGKPVAEATFKQAIDLGLVKPSGDGLFDADTSQTWIAA